MQRYFAREHYEGAVNACVCMLCKIVEMFLYSMAFRWA